MSYILYPYHQSLHRGMQTKHLKMRALICVVVFSSLFEQAATLSIGSNAGKRNAPIKRVAIVGGGISGLSLAHALKNAPSLCPKEDAAGLDVTIFDSRPTLDFQTGSGVQLNGGMAVLGKINQDVQKAAIDAALPIGTLRGRNKSWGKDKSESKLWDFDIGTIFRKAGGKAAEELLVDDKPIWYAIMRGALQEALAEALPQDDSMKLVFDKCLVDFSVKDDEAFCEFADGSQSGPFDLVVGCDGIKSAVKEYIEKGKISRDSSVREGNAAALYSGIRVAFAVTDADDSERNRSPRSIKQVFADGAYILRGTFGNGKDRPACDCIFVTSLDDNFNGPFKRKDYDSASSVAENADWTQDRKLKKEESKQRMIRQLSSNNIPGEDIASLIESSDRFFELGVYFHNPLTFSGWSKPIPSSNGAFMVLCGDSAHAMPPFLGQGANQAIQDSFALAQKIHQFNAALKSDSVLHFNKLLNEYEHARWGPTASITGKAAILGYLETGGRNGFYSKFRDLLFNFLAFVGIPQKVLLDAANPKV